MAIGIKDFSIIVNTWGPRPATAREMIEVAVRAEQLGFYSVGLTHLPVLPHADEDPPGHLAFIPEEVRDWYVDPLVVLPMIAQATSSIKIGFNVFSTPWIHPFVTAKYLASLDVVSGGRLVAGFGLGVAPPPHRINRSLTSIGLDSRRRGAMSDEALELITELWRSNEPVDYKGEFYVAEQLAIQPRPVQVPYPELWWAGEGRASMVRAAKYARFLESAWASPETLASSYVPRLEAQNQAHGGHAKVAICSFYALMSENTDATPAEVSAHFWGYTPDQLSSVIAGSIEQCARAIRSFDRAGAGHFTLDMHRHGQDHVSTLHEQMEDFVTRVLPKVQY